MKVFPASPPESERCSIRGCLGPRVGGGALCKRHRDPLWWFTNHEAGVSDTALWAALADHGFVDGAFAAASAEERARVRALAERLLFELTESERVREESP